MFCDADDKKTGSTFLTLAGRGKIENVLNINNSDMEMCGYPGRTIIYYSRGDRKGNEFPAEACF